VGSAHNTQKVLKFSVKAIMATFQGNTTHNQDANSVQTPITQHLMETRPSVTTVLPNVAH
jgi:hypothetical protein